jgi:LemA protein
VALQTYGQDSTCQINASWTDLKTQLKRRSDIVSNLTVVLSNLKTDKELLNNLKIAAIDVFKYVDTLSLRNSVAVSLAATKNNKLTESLGRTLITTENNKKISSNKEFINLLMQLEGCENRIVVAKQDYNNACKICNRTDLVFNVEQVNNVPKVKF